MRLNVHPLAFASIFCLLSICPPRARADIYQYTVLANQYTLVFDEPTLESGPFSVTSANLLVASPNVPGVESIVGASFCPLASEGCVVLPFSSPQPTYAGFTLETMQGPEEFFSTFSSADFASIGTFDISYDLYQGNTINVIDGSITIADLSTEVPEIDPAAGASALALLGGALWIVRGRRKLSEVAFD